MSAGAVPDPELVRAAVRELVAELRDERASAAAGRPGRAASPAGVADGALVTVSVGTDTELAAFVARLAGLLDEPGTAERIRDGRLRFRLEAGAGTEKAPAAELRVDDGVLTEKLVSSAARDCGRLILGPGVIATPLALDRARTLGITIERET